MAMRKTPAKKAYNKKRKGVARKNKSILGPRQTQAFAGPLVAQPLRELKASKNFLNESRTVRLQYCEQITLQSQTVLTAMGTPNYFGINDAFDPNNTGSGHQPRGYDQLTVMFNKYRVLGARVRVEFAVPTTTTMWVGLHLLNSQQAVYTAGTSHDYVAEVPGTQIFNVPQDSKQVIIDTGYIPIWELEGMTYPQWVGDDGFDANYNASPAAISKVGVFVGDWAAPASVSSLLAIVYIEYNVKFYSAKTVTTS